MVSSSNEGRLQHGQAGRRPRGRGDCPMSAALVHDMDLSWWETPSGLSCELVARRRSILCRLGCVILGHLKFLDLVPRQSKLRSMQTVHPLDAAARDRRKCVTGVTSGNWMASDPIVPPTPRPSPRRQVSLTHKVASVGAAPSRSIDAVWDARSRAGNAFAQHGGRGAAGARGHHLTA
jgi:hypothetical protein